MGGNQRTQKETPEEVTRLLRFRGCVDAYKNGDEVTATFHESDSPTGKLIGSKPQKVMLDRGYAVARISPGEGGASVTYRKLTEL